MVSAGVELSVRTDATVCGAMRVIGWNRAEFSHRPSRLMLIHCAGRSRA